MANWLTPLTGRPSSRTAAIDAERARMNADAEERRQRLDAEVQAITARAAELDQILNDITQHRRGRND